MYYNPDEGFSASSWLGTIADAMYNEYLDYWEQQNIDIDSQLSEDQRRQFGLLIELTAALKPCLHSLSLDSEAVERIRLFMRELGLENEVDRDFADRILHVLQSHAIVEHGLQIELAGEAADTLLAGAETRFGLLLSLVTSRSLSRIAAAYLDRATRLYLWGFEPESIVMCAAVLEAAYPERFTSLDMLRLQVHRRGDDFAPNDYEVAALAEGVFSKKQRELAKTIRHARNDVVHTTVGITSLSARHAIVGTADLLRCLFPR